MNMVENKKERESGFELVRIIAMFMIVANHLVNHGVFKVTSQTPYSLWQSMSPFNQAVGAVVSCGGRIGVAVFFMITGYFLAEREKISLRSLFSFLGRVHFFGILMFAVLLVLNRVTGYGSEIDMIKTAKRSLCIPAAVWWFALVYLVLLFLAPSINVLIRSFRHNALFLLILYIWYFFYSSGGGEGIPLNFVKGVLFYMMGVFVRLFEKNVRKRWH